MAAALVVASVAWCQSLIDDFSTNTIAPANWTTSVTKASVQIRAANQRLEYTSLNDSAVALDELNIARVSSVWGLGCATDFRLKVRMNFVPQTPSSSASNHTGVAIHLGSVDAAMPAGSIPDGILIRTGTEKDGSNLYRYLQVERVTNNGATTTELFSAGSVGNNSYVFRTDNGASYFFPIGERLAFLRYQASLGRLFLSFSSFTDANALAIDVQPPSAARPLRLSLVGFAVGSIRALGGANAWFDDVFLESGTRCYRPVDVAASQGTSTAAVTVTWSAPAGATKYYVYRENGVGTAALLPNCPVTTPTYTDTTALPGAQHRYLVRAESPGGVSESSDFASGWRALAPPATVSATDGTSATHVTVTWTASTGATSYKVLRAQGAAAPAAIATVNHPTLSYTDTTAVPGVPYTYSIVASCGLGDSAPSASNPGHRSITAPTLTNVAPSAGPLAGGTTLTLTGTNFVPVSGATSVTVGGVAATSVNAVNATSLTCVTPAGTAGIKDVVVTTLGGSATRLASFTYMAPPTLAAVSPISGSMTGGTTITLTGGSFVAGSTTVTVGGVAAAAVNVTSPTSLTCVTPASAAGAKNVVVSTPGGAATKSAAFTYVVPAPPTIASVTPAAGPLAGGTTITVNGTNFVAVAGATSVTVGGVAATAVTVTSPTSLTCVTPAGTAGAKNVVVTTAGGSGPKTSAFTYMAAPTLSSVAPTSGYTSGGTTITLTGNNFVTGATSVTVGGVAATAVNVASATTLTCVTPAGTAGLTNIVVASPGGSFLKASAFTFVVPPPPTLTTVSPSAGPLVGGTAVTLTGTFFIPGATTVKVGDVAATAVNVTSPTSLSCVTPAGTVGTKPVTVTTPGGTMTKSGAFTHMPPPTLGTVLPSSGPMSGGTTITLTGTNFVTSMTSVMVGGVAATNVTVSSATKVTCVTPAGTVGTKPVTVTTPGGSATVASGFTHVAPPPPTLVSVSPNKGPLAGGTTITLTGTNFFAGGTTVKVGEIAATAVVVTSTTSLTCVTPATSPGGPKNVTVTTPGGSASKTGAFTYEAASPPTITSVSPTSGSANGGTTVMLTGTNFVSGATGVTIGGVTVQSANITVTSTTSLNFKTPAGTPGAAQPIAVSTSAGVATKPGAFTYIAAPTITSVSPAFGPKTGGTTITITGTNLSGVTSVMIGDGAATSVFLSSNSMLTAKTPASATTGARTVTVTTPGGTATRTNGFTYNVAFTGGDPGGMPGGGRDGEGGPSDTPPPDGSQPVVVTMERCIELIRQSSAAPADCVDTPCADLPPATLAPVLDSPTGPDLDGNGVPDLCQLRCGDLDMSDHIDMGDLAVLLSMFGEEPVLGIGDLNGDGVIDGVDLQALQAVMREAADTTPN